MTDLPAPADFNAEQVMHPKYRVEFGSERAADCCHLFMQTFELTTDESSWHSTAESDWSKVATIWTDRVAIYPVHANPHAQRYLTPQHGRFRTIIYIDGRTNALPADAGAANEQLTRRLPQRLFKDVEPGRALANELEEVWRTLQLLEARDTLIVDSTATSRLSADEIVVNEQDLDDLRKAMNRIDRRKRDGVRMAKRSIVFNDLLTKLNPEHFGNSAPTAVLPASVAPGLRSRRFTSIRREASRRVVDAFKESLPALAAQSPSALLELQADIERVTLAEMITRFESLLSKNFPENQWQSFFEANQFVLTLVFARPVRLIHTQFHAQGSSIGGTGAQIGDFLLRELGQGLALVEIKKPGTELMRGRPYRNTQVYAPTDELSGAVTQTLLQQSHVRSNWLVHRGQKLLGQSMPDAIKCVVIAGTYPNDEHQRRSFEVFRNACQNVEVVTFDELLGKLKLLLEHLGSPQQQAAGSRA